MARFHLATITPTKAELIAAWSPTQQWGFGADVDVDVIGSYRFDDPDGRVGMETHLVNAGGALFQVPLTYRDEPLEGAGDGFIAEVAFNVCGERVDRLVSTTAILLQRLHRDPVQITSNSADKVLLLLQQST